VRWQDSLDRSSSGADRAHSSVDIFYKMAYVRRAAGWSSGGDVADLIQALDLGRSSRVEASGGK
jgi:hypothetical protein